MSQVGFAGQQTVDQHTESLLASALGIKICYRKAKRHDKMWGELRSCEGGMALQSCSSLRGVAGCYTSASRYKRCGVPTLSSVGAFSGKIGKLKTEGSEMTLVLKGNSGSQHL